MKEDLKTELKKVMAFRNIKVPKLAQGLDIPKDRIYAWYRDDTNPKGEDRDKILRWLDEENFTLESKAPEIYRLKNDKEGEIIKLKAIIKTLSHALAKVQAKVFGRPFEDCLEELEQNTRINERDLLN